MRMFFIILAVGMTALNLLVIAAGRVNMQSVSNLCVTVLSLIALVLAGRK